MMWQLICISGVGLGLGVITGYILILVYYIIRQIFTGEV